MWVPRCRKCGNDKLILKPVGDTGIGERDPNRVWLYCAECQTSIVLLDVLYVKL